MPQETASAATSTDRVVIVGGGSRAGRALAARLSGCPVIPIVRHSEGLPGERIVAAYDGVPKDLDLHGAAIVNCAGTPHGDAATLDAANRAVPLAWARRAASDGAARFVQISSFSVFGPAERIDTATPPAPTSDYGRSKLAAEAALAGVGLGDRLTILRVPILIGGGSDKLAQLVGIARRTGMIPTAARPCPRSMLSYDGLAATIAGVIEKARGGVVHAADPEPYTPIMLRDAARAQGMRARIVRLPGPVAALVRMAAPGIHASLLAPNVLSADANIASGFLPFERLPEVLDRLLRGELGLRQRR